MYLFFDCRCCCYFIVVFVDTNGGGEMMLLVVFVVKIKLLEAVVAVRTKDRFKRYELVPHLLKLPIPSVVGNRG